MSVTRDKAPHLLLIFPGPVHDVADHFKNRMEHLSENFRGSVFVSGAAEGNAVFGRFRFHTIPESSAGKLRSLYHLVRRALAVSDEAVANGDPFDMVVTYDPLKSGIVGSLVARRRRLPLIVEVNGEYAAAENFADITNPVARWLKRMSFVMVSRLVLRGASGIKLLADQQIDAFRSGLRNPVIRTFPNYVDLSPYENLGETPEVLFAGYPFYRKGVDVLIAAFKAVSDEFPDWHLKIMGWFPDQTDLQRAIGGHPRIIVHPPVYHREIPGHIGRCGIFVLPSRSEAMGRVLIEAMACGKPRIGSNVGGIPSVINDGEDGILTAPGSVEELTASLRRLMGDPALRRRLGDNGARRAHEQLSAQVYFGRIAELYGAVLNGR